MMRKDRFNYDIETIAYKRIEQDIEFYRKHEKSLLDEVKLRKLDELLQRIRGVSYCLGRDDEKLKMYREMIMENKKHVFNRLEDSDWKGV